MVQVTSRMMTRWIDGQRRQLEVNSAMTDLTMEIAAETFFGTDLASQTQELSQAVTCLSEYATRELGKPFSLPNWLPLASIRKKLHAINYLNQTLDRLVAERRASQEDRGDLLSMLLQARDHEGDGKGLTDEQVRHQMMTLFLAGHDTTAGTLPWVWYLLAKHPEVEAKVRQELQQVLGDNPASFDSFQKLTYTTMVVKETLRMYPQAYVMFARVAAEDVEVGGYHIPREARCIRCRTFFIMMPAGLPTRSVLIPSDFPKNVFQHYQVARGSVWCWTARLHRCPLRHHGNGAGRRHHHATPEAEHS